MNNKITVLLTRYHDTWGKIICFFTKSEYSHASVSLDGNDFYSFNYFGFIREQPKQKNKHGLAISFYVSDEEYRTIDKRIQNFRQNKERYKYTMAGLILCILKIPHKFRNKYICSEFVAETLEEAGVVELNKSSSLYLPSHLKTGLKYRRPVLCSEFKN